MLRKCVCVCVCVRVRARIIIMHLLSAVHPCKNLLGCAHKTLVQNKVNIKISNYAAAKNITK